MSAVKEIIKWVLIFAGVFIVQTIMIPKIAIFGIYPDLVLILLFVVSVQYGIVAGIWCGFFVGLLIDVFSSGLLGANALAKTLIGGCAGFLERKNILIAPILLLILLLLVIIIHDIIVYIPNIYVYKESVVELPKFLFFNSLPRAIYTVLTATVLYIISDLLFALKIRR